MQATSNVFGHVPQAGADSVFDLARKFNEDKHPNKVSLVIGAYRDNEGKPKVFDVVKKVEKEMLEEKPALDKEYLQMEGEPEFRKLTKALVFSPKCPLLDKIVTVQALSGTGALYLGANFLANHFPKSTKVYLSNPTWANHGKIFLDSGFEATTNYPYYNAATNSLDFKGMTETLSKAPAGSIILLHACAHNPTGIDPTPDQWKEIAKICIEHKLLPFMDLAYQGFATGDLEKDAYSVRLFAEMGLQFLCAQSFAKNTGLYGERIGAIHVVCADAATAEKVFGNLKLDVRGIYSNPPLHGARIVARILRDPANFEAWKTELKAVAGRIQDMRKLLFDELVKLKTPGNWEHILHQIGMFSYTGLSEAQCRHLTETYHIYLLANGRISMAGVNIGNVKYLASAIYDAVIKFPKKV